MIPADSFPSEVQEPADVVAGQALEPSKRGKRAARKRARAARQPRAEDKSALVAWAFAEYERCRQRGQPPDIQQWCAQFPSCRSALRQMLEFQHFAADCLEKQSFLDRGPVSNSSDESIHWPIVGSQRGDFTILRELARGAFARVYLAAEASTGGRLVALKCSLHGDAEARTMGRLAHPHVVPILSARIDEESGLTLVSMPYLGSATLEDVLDHFWAAAETSPPSRAAFLLDVIRFRAQPEDPLPPAVDPCLLHGSYCDGIIRLTVQLAETLAYLHQHGVCHRDLKPSNVLLDPAGKPLLLDFNLSENEREAVVPLGGTLRYMAPEQLRAFLDKRKTDMDERGDFFALGVMIYDLLGGVHPCAAVLAEPFSRAQAEALVVQLQAGFRPFREICPELAHPVATVLDRCLALDAADRPCSATELAAALKQQFTPVRRVHRWFARHRVWTLAMMSSLLIALVILASLWILTPPYSQREYDRGRIAYHAGDFGAAEGHFDRAVRAEPNNSRFRFARGCARLQQSKYQPTDKVRFEQIADDVTSAAQGAADARSLALLAYIQLRKQNYETAIMLYKNQELFEYRPLMVLNNRAYSYINRDRLQEAKKDLDQAIKLDPHCQAARYNRALIAMLRHFRREIQSIPPHVLEDIESAIRGGPQSSELFRDAAILYAQAAKHERHQEHLDRAVSYLRQAIEAGEPPTAFDGFPSLRNALGRSEFAALLLRQQPKASVQQQLQILDPLDLLD